MSGPHTIEPLGRTKPCAEGCRHPTCAALAKLERNERVQQLRDRVMNGCTCGDSLDFERALDELAKLARGEG